MFVNSFSSDLLPLLFTAIVSLLLITYALFVNWVVFTRAGVPGWKSLIPFYNSMQLYQMVGFSKWLVLLAFIPYIGFASVIVTCIVNYKVCKCFGLSKALCVIGIFIPLIPFTVIMLYPKYEYNGILF